MEGHFHRRITCITTRQQEFVPRVLSSASALGVQREFIVIGKFPFRESSRLPATGVIKRLDIQIFRSVPA